MYLVCIYFLIRENVAKNFCFEKIYLKYFSVRTIVSCLLKYLGTHWTVFPCVRLSEEEF